MGGIVLDSGYACLTSSEFSKGFFRERFSLALKPSLASELAEKLQTDRWGLLKYYSSLAPRLDEIDAVAREGALESGKALVARTVKMCEPYFPRGHHLSRRPSLWWYSGSLRAAVMSRSSWTSRSGWITLRTSSTRWHTRFSTTSTTR